MATAQDIVDLDAQAHEILKRAGNGSLEVADIRRGFQLIIEKRLGEPSPVGLAVSQFTPQMEQVSNLLQWNEALSLGLSNADIQNVPQAVLDFAWDKPLVSITLCWTLGTLEETLNAKLAVLRHVYGEKKVIVSPDFKTDAKHTFLPDGAPEFVPNHIWWQVIDLGANRKLSPDKVPAAVAAGVEVFDNACQHKGHVKRHNGSDTPYWDVPGLRVKVPGESRLCAPYVSGYSDGYIRVGVRWADGGALSDYSVPVRES